jgi:hypothetical protein
VSDPDTTHGAVIRDFQHERAKLIDLLSKSRALLAGARSHMKTDDIISPSPAREELRVRIDAFLDAGLFGDK